MSERVQVILYTVVASATLWFGVERFLGTTEEYASRLDIRNTPQDPNRDPENEAVNPSSPISPAAARRAETETTATVAPAADGAGSHDDDGAEEAPPEHDEGAVRLTVADAERADSDGDVREDVVAVPGRSAEEAAMRFPERS